MVCPLALAVDKRGEHMSYLSLRNIRKIYMEGMDNQVNALDGVDLDIEQGEFLAIVGASGSGKSTMMNILGCLDVPTYGEYSINGEPVAQMNMRQLANIRSREISFIFQGYNLIPSLSVLDNVALPMTYQKVRKSIRLDRAMSALEQVDIAEKAENKPMQLSGGQQQRVAIARAMAAGAPILMADEPTGALDSKTGAQVLGLLKEMSQRGTTVILITHDLSIAAHARRVVTMKDGKLIKDVLGSTIELESAGGHQ